MLCREPVVDDNGQRADTIVAELWGSQIGADRYNRTLLLRSGREQVGSSQMEALRDLETKAREVCPEEGVWKRLINWWHC